MRGSTSLFVALAVAGSLLSAAEALSPQLADAFANPSDAVFEIEVAHAFPPCFFLVRQRFAGPARFVARATM